MLLLKTAILVSRHGECFCLKVDPHAFNYCYDPLWAQGVIISGLFITVVCSWHCSWNIGPAHVISISTEVYFYLEYGFEQIVQQYEWLERDLQVSCMQLTCEFHFCFKVNLTHYNSVRWEGHLGQIVLNVVNTEGETVTPADSLILTVFKTPRPRAVVKLITDHPSSGHKNMSNISQQNLLVLLSVVRYLLFL